MKQITKPLIPAAALLTTGVALSACRDDRPGHDSDRHHHHHDGDHGQDHDHDH